MLFVLDDGPTMGDKLATFRASLPAMLESLAQYAAAGAAAEYHFGVITADLGAGPSALPTFGCLPGGDGAKLRASADTSGGVRYIDDDQVAGTSNVPDVATALAALTDVGTAGCAFRQPLEAAYRALHDRIAENSSRTTTPKAARRPANLRRPHASCRCSVSRCSIPMARASCTARSSIGATARPTTRP